MVNKLALLGGDPLRTRPFPQWPVTTDKDEGALVDVLRSGHWTRHQGGQVAAFEAAFAAYQNARYGIAVMNGTVAQRIALIAAGVQAGDEVIVPPYTFFSTASAVVEANAVPVFVDIDPQTYCLDAELLEAAITERTRAIIPVHFGGRPAEMDRIQEIAGKHNLLVIEDAAHGHGAEYRGQRLGAIGQMGFFSFQASKNLSSGEGGIILTNDEQYERLCRSLHTCGRYPEAEWYDHFTLGGNYRMTEFQGALLMSQLEILDSQTDKRDRNGLYLSRKLEAIPGIRPLERGPEVTRHSYHLFIFRYDREAFYGLERQVFLQALAAEGVPCFSGYPIPLYKQPVFLERVFGPYQGGGSAEMVDYNQVSCPACELACASEACWLGHPLLLGDEKDMDDIASAITKIYQDREALL